MNKPIAIGQVWADRDSREVAKDARQRLLVVEVGTGRSARVKFRDELTGHSSWVAISRLNRFRLIEE